MCAQNVRMIDFEQIPSISSFKIELISILGVMARFAFYKSRENHLKFTQSENINCWHFYLKFRRIILAVIPEKLMLVT